jgi:hypothetical protein
MMEGAELRRRLDRFGRPYTQLAPLLGLSIDGLHHQMRGNRRVSRQTEMLLELLERGCRVEPEKSPQSAISTGTTSPAARGSRPSRRSHLA